jgi:hypothetical protein
VTNKPKKVAFDIEADYSELELRTLGEEIRRAYTRSPEVEALFRYTERTGRTTELALVEPRPLNEFQRVLPPPRYNIHDELLFIEWPVDEKTVSVLVSPFQAKRRGLPERSSIHGMASAQIIVEPMPEDWNWYTYPRGDVLGELYEPPLPVGPRHASVYGLLGK